MRTKKFDIFVSIVAVIVFRPISIYHWVDGYPTELLEIDDETDTTYTPSWEIDDKDNENNVARREEALENLQKVRLHEVSPAINQKCSMDKYLSNDKIFDIRGQIENKSTNRKKTPPQFMMELYNTIADSSGVTRGKNPYNAKVVRSFIERDTLFSHLYLFNISGLEINESVLEAELHLYRRRTSLKSIHPSVLTSPYYLIRVYQVLEGKSMSEPDLHRLLNVHYVGAHASGWQVFNVKQAVLAWVSGAPNLGLMVTASNLFDDEVKVEFSRRHDNHNGKQPILVLFDDDGRGPTKKSSKINSHYYTYDNEAEDYETDAYYDRHDDVNDDVSAKNDNNDNSRRRKRNRETMNEKGSSKWEKIETSNEEHHYGTQLGNKNRKNDETEYFQRHKRIGNDHQEERIFPHEVKNFLETSLTRDENNEKSNDFSRQKRDAIERDRYENRKIVAKKFVTEKRGTRVPEILASMDIYERAMLRQGITKKIGKKNGARETKEKDDLHREKRSSLMNVSNDNVKTKSHSSTRENTTECSRHELYVDFKDIGLSTSIIAPKGYSAYHCQGLCDSPLSQDQQPTNHATVQGIVHKMALVPDVHMPCCVPTKLVSTTILFFDENENVVLKVYEDMIADRCGCR